MDLRQGRMFEIRRNVIDRGRVDSHFVRQDAMRNLVLGIRTFLFRVVFREILWLQCMIGIAVNYKIICKVLIARGTIRRSISLN